MTVHINQVNEMMMMRMVKESVAACTHRKDNKNQRQHNLNQSIEDDNRSPLDQSVVQLGLG